jgi:hypothetical protein
LVHLSNTTINKNNSLPLYRVSTQQDAFLEEYYKWVATSLRNAILIVPMQTCFICMLPPKGLFVFISRSDGWDTCNIPTVEWLTKDFGYEIYIGSKGVITAFRGREKKFAMYCEIDFMAEILGYISCVYKKYLLEDPFCATRIE